MEGQISVCWHFIHPQDDRLWPCFTSNPRQGEAVAGRRHNDGRKPKAFHIVNDSSDLFFEESNQAGFD
jgi:hypothetical protein